MANPGNSGPGLCGGEAVVIRRSLGVVALAVVTGVVAAVVTVGRGVRVLLLHLAVEVDLVLERDLPHQEVHDTHLVELLDRLLVFVLHITTMFGATRQGSGERGGLRRGKEGGDMTSYLSKAQEILEVQRAKREGDAVDRGAVVELDEADVVQPGVITMMVMMIISRCFSAINSAQPSRAYGM